MLVDALDLAGAGEIAAGGFDVAEAGVVPVDFAGAAPVDFAGTGPVDLAGASAAELMVVALEAVEAASSDFEASAATFVLAAPEAVCVTELAAPPGVCVTELAAQPLAWAADVAVPSTLFAWPATLFP